LLGTVVWMASRATIECWCGHSRDRHRDSVFTGSCMGDCVCTAFEAPPPDPEPSMPEPDRTPHPACPLQDPDCRGFHPQIF
jgi:hypothetical protein